MQRVCVPKWESRISRILRNMPGCYQRTARIRLGSPRQKGFPFPHRIHPRDPTRLSRIISKFLPYGICLCIRANKYTATLSARTGRVCTNKMDLSARTRSSFFHIREMRQNFFLLSEQKGELSRTNKTSPTCPWQKILGSDQIHFVILHFSRVATLGISGSRQVAQIRKQRSIEAGRDRSASSLNLSLPG